MLKIIRILLFTVALYLYFLFIIKDPNTYSAVSKILLVTILLITMELIRSRSNKAFKQSSKLEVIDYMNQQKFVGYVAEMHKRLGYSINLPTDAEAPLCDIVLYKGRLKYYAKCYHSIEELENIELENLTKLYSNIKKAKVVFFTNANCTDQLRHRFAIYDIEIKDRTFFISSIDTIQALEDKTILHLNMAK
ncbi:MAG: hypothetical protein BEN19_01175 [Epulopiscium sp. Nuni2H_MBin003]|nr:MAG: hypothetical protein BEN19_01175 [Epulopiscium sp. Nuni2H_MBin003]